jgi:hypothetical protein
MRICVYAYWTIHTVYYNLTRGAAPPRAPRCHRKNLINSNTCFIRFKKKIIKFFLMIRYFLNKLFYVNSLRKEMHVLIQHQTIY